VDIIAETNTPSDFDVVQIIKHTLTIEELARMASAMFGNLVKGVVDAEREILAVDAELHSDLEALLIEDGSKSRDLWGINLYPELQGADFIEFDSMINVRPSQDNRSRGVDDPRIRQRIEEIVARRISR
jgi:hypothetical protein